MARIRTITGRTRPRTEAALLLALGAIGGVLLGVAIADRLGGVDGLRRRVRPRAPREKGTTAAAPVDLAGATDGSEVDPQELERRVLEAFRHDPLLAQRAIDISAAGDGVTLTGWVRDADEQRHATVLARGVPGVAAVQSELAVMPITFRG